MKTICVTCAVLAAALGCGAKWMTIDDFSDNARGWIYGGDVKNGAAYQPIRIGPGAGRESVAILEWKDVPGNNVDYAELFLSLPKPVDLTRVKATRFTVWQDHPGVVYYHYFYDGTNGVWSDTRYVKTGRWETVTIPMMLTAKESEFNREVCREIKICVRNIAEGGPLGEGTAYIDDFEMDIAPAGEER